MTGEARNLIGTLNNAAGFTASRENTLANVLETCDKVAPTAEATDLIMPAGNGKWRNATVMEAIHHSMDRARAVNREILDLSAFVPSDIIRHIVEIENHGYFKHFESVYRSYQRGELRNTNLAFIGRNISTTCCWLTALTTTGASSCHRPPHERQD